MHNFHLLIADDHEAVRFIFRLALESNGYDVDTAETISEALSPSGAATLRETQLHQSAVAASERARR